MFDSGRWQWLISYRLANTMFFGKFNYRCGRAHTRTYKRMHKPSAPQRSKPFHRLKGRDLTRGLRDNRASEIVHQTPKREISMGKCKISARWMRTSVHFASWSRGYKSERRFCNASRKQNFREFTGRCRSLWLRLLPVFCPFITQGGDESVLRENSVCSTCPPANFSKIS